ncbi:unnamed protein product [Acidithrix sp. C25]|nr:unnamed protein product [Acidithrix sp. C25]
MIHHRLTPDGGSPIRTSIEAMDRFSEQASILTTTKTKELKWIFNSY